MINDINKRVVRDYLNLCVSCIFLLLYLPHLLCFVFNRNLNNDIKQDLKRRKDKISIELSPWLLFIFYIHNDRFFRNLFYHRVGPFLSILIGWYRPGDKYFTISKTTIVGPGAYFVHPFSSIINAKSIGYNFSCRHLTTIGNKIDGDNHNRPIIGNNVTIGVNVTIIGDVRIGNNVIIGAGSVVVKDIPDNCIAVGNPCKPIKFVN